MAEKKEPEEAIRGDVVSIKPSEQFVFQKRAETPPPSPQPPDRKLAPLPGRAPACNSVPEDEILPRR